MRLLVVDDNRDAADSLAAVLRLIANANVVVVYDGSAAVSTVAQAVDRFDAIISDIDMPKMDGISAANAIRKLPNAPPLLIALSGREGLSGLEVMAAFDHVLAKPVTIHVLTVLLQAA